MENALLIFSFLVFLVMAYFLLDRLLKNDERRRKLEIKKELSKELIMVRLRAYERLALFLERIKPNEFLIRNLDQDSTGLDLQVKLLELLRQEYGHNVSQQIYVSSELWLEIVFAKESLISLINSSSAHCDLTAPASLLAEKIVQTYAASSEDANGKAFCRLKEEIALLL